MNSPEIHLIILVIILIILVFLALTIWLFVLVGKAAKKRGRSVAGWIIFAIFFTCLLAWIVLAVLGETDEKRRQKIIEEEKLRASVRQKQELPPYTDGERAKYRNHERYMPNE